MVILRAGSTPTIPARTLAVFSKGQRSIGTPDGGLLLPAVPCGRARLLIGKPGGNFFLLVDTVEQTGPPAVLLSTSEVAFIAGTASDQTVVIASARDGRLVRRLQG